MSHFYKDQNLKHAQCEGCQLYFVRFAKRVRSASYGCAMSSDECKCTMVYYSAETLVFSFLSSNVRGDGDDPVDEEEDQRQHGHDHLAQVLPDLGPVPHPVLASGRAPGFGFALLASIADLYDLEYI